MLASPRKELNEFAIALTTLCTQADDCACDTPLDPCLRSVESKGTKQQTDLRKKGDSWNKRTKRSHTKTKRPSSRPPLRGNGARNTQTTTYISDSYYRLHRADQATLFRLRRGHNRMRAHLYNKMRIGQARLCPCDTAPMDTAHVPQDCPLRTYLGLQQWRPP